MNDSQAIDPNGGSNLKSQAVQAAEELRSAATASIGRVKEVAHDRSESFSETATDQAQQIREAAETGWEEAKVKAQDLMQEGEAYVRENPGKSVATALGVGFVLGLLFRR